MLLLKKALSRVIIQANITNGPVTREGVAGGKAQPGNVFTP